MIELKSYVPMFEHFFHFRTRGFRTITETENFDGLGVLTVDFKYPSGEHN
jgi:hypothetical protein